MYWSRPSPFFVEMHLIYRLKQPVIVSQPCDNILQDIFFLLRFVPLAKEESLTVALLFCLFSFTLVFTKFLSWERLEQSKMSSNLPEWMLCKNIILETFATGHEQDSKWDQKYQQDSNIYQWSVLDRVLKQSNAIQPSPRKMCIYFKSNKHICQILCENHRMTILGIKFEFSGRNQKNSARKLLGCVT